jgi:hypothetical protein
MNDLFHAPQTAGVCDTFRVTLEVLAKLRGYGNRLSEKIISAPAPENLDALENVIDRLLLESRNAEQLIRLTQRFQLVDRLDLETIVDFLGCLRTDTRNLDSSSSTDWTWKRS